MGRAGLNRRRSVEEIKAMRRLENVNLEGIFVCGVGYPLKKEEIVKFFEAKKLMYITTKKIWNSR